MKKKKITQFQLNLKKFSKNIYMSLKKNYKLNFFFLKKKKYELYKTLYLIFFLKFNFSRFFILNFFLNTLFKKIKKITLKFKYYLSYFYKYSFYNTKDFYCIIKTIFYLRNFTIIFKKNKFFKFYTLGLIILNKKNKTNSTFLITFIKLFFFYFLKFLNNNIYIYITNFSKRLHIFLHYLNYYIEKGNNDIFKYQYLFIKNIFFKNNIKYLSLTRPKKPRSKKIFRKKNKSYNF